MNEIYEQAKDLHVRAITVYGNPTNHKLYKKLSGGTYSEALTASEIADLFDKNVLLIDAGYAVTRPIGKSGEKVLTLAKTGEPTVDFSATKTSYAIGDVILHDGVALRCSTSISAAAAYDSTKWTAITTTDFVEWGA